MKQAVVLLVVVALAGCASARRSVRAPPTLEQTQRPACEERLPFAPRPAKEITKAAQLSPSIEYPRRDAMAGNEGIVRIAVEITHDGEIRCIDVLTSSGNERLDTAVVEGIARSFNIKPGRVGAEEVDSVAAFAFDFQAELRMRHRR